MSEPTGKLLMIQLTQITPCKNNPRIVNDKSDEFAEMVDSITASGVIIPVHVRQVGKKYELLAGTRRVMASAKAKRDTIPVIDHGDISDAEAFQITFTENFARKDLTILEQGKAASLLLEKYGGDAEAAASMMGKSTRWILQRKAIDLNLSDGWKEISQDGEWSASHLQLIAAMPAEAQASLHDEYNNACLAKGDLPTVKELEKEIAGRMMLLSKAVWLPKEKFSGAIIEKVPSCPKCQKRSSVQPGLFDDASDAEQIKKNDRCLDHDCWRRKTGAFIDQQAKKLLETHGHFLPAVMPSQKLSYSDERQLEKKYGAISDDWKAAKEDEKGAVPILIVHGKNAGEIRWAKTLKITSKNGTARKVAADGKGKPKTLKERQELLDRKRWFSTIHKLIGQIEEIELASLVIDDPERTIMALAVMFGVKGEGLNGWEWLEEYKQEALVKLWEEVRKTIFRSLAYCGPITQVSDRLISNAKAAAALCGIDILYIFDQVAETEYPEPKSWASLKEDGTPKTAKKTTAKKIGQENNEEKSKEGCEKNLQKESSEGR